MIGFSVVYRDYGEWDIFQNSQRIFRIRGSVGEYYILAENQFHDNVGPLNTIQACMSYICDLLMYEKEKEE